MNTLTAPRFAIGLAVVLLVLVLGFAAYKLFLFNSSVSELPADGSDVVFVHQGAGERYRLTDKVLKRFFPAPMDNGVVIEERVTSPLGGGEAVIALVPEIRGHAFGLLGEDGMLTLLVSGDTHKNGLVVTDAGIAVFAAMPAPESDALAAGAQPSEEAAEDGVEEKGYASGPVDFGPIPSPTGSASELIAMNLRTGAILSLGRGASPRLLPDGSVLAIAPEGLVKIDPATAGRTLVFAQPETDTTGAAGSVSPSGRTVALPASPTSLLFLRVSEDGSSAEHLGNLTREGGSMNAVLVDDEHVFVRVSPNIARYYFLPDGELPTRPIALVSVTQ